MWIAELTRTRIARITDTTGRGSRGSLTLGLAIRGTLQRFRPDGRYGCAVRVRGSDAGWRVSRLPGPSGPARPRWFPCRRARDSPLPEMAPPAPSRLLPVELIYGFINPLIYLLIFQPYGAFRPRKPIDDWMDPIAWTLFIALWGSRLLLPRTLEASPAARTRLARLCLLGLVVLAGFALSDLTRVWGHHVWGAGPRVRPWWGGAWLLVAFAPLYAIPAFLLEGYRSRLIRPGARARFLLLSPRLAVRLAVGASVVVAVIGFALSILRPSDATARARTARARSRHSRDRQPLRGRPPSAGSARLRDPSRPEPAISQPARAPGHDHVPRGRG